MKQCDLFLSEKSVLKNHNRYGSTRQDKCRVLPVISITMGSKALGPSTPRTQLSQEAEGAGMVEATDWPSTQRQRHCSRPDTGD